MKIDKSKLFNIAHAIYRKEETPTLGEALKQAWKVVRLYSSLLRGKVEFTFRKINGEIRLAVGTLADINYTPSTKGNKRIMPADQICYFDVEKNGFRSFNAANLISY